MWQKIFLSYVLLITTSLYSDQNITNPIVNETIIYNLPEAPSGDSNKTNWNIKNWDKSLKGTSDGAVGNTMMFMNDSPFLKRGMTADTSKLTTESFNTDSNASQAAIGYTDNYKSQVMSNVVTNSSYTPNQTSNENTLKCFIARDIPFRYKCEETNLVYGGSTLAQTAGGQISNMDGMSGKEALNLCRENCKREVECLEVESNSANSANLANISFSLESNATHAEEYLGIDNAKAVKYLNFEVNATSISNLDNQIKEDPKIYMDISYINDKNQNIYIVKNVWVKLLRGQEQIGIRAIAKKFVFKFSSLDSNTTSNLELTNVSVDYESGSKYICAALQDVSALEVSSSFASRCPNGIITEFGGFEICSDGIYAGDNHDGTYSDKTRCDNICNIPRKCNVEIGHFDADIFEQFREGRLGRIAADGEYTSADMNAIMSDTDCTNARVLRKQVINEVVFDAKNLPYQTVLNGSLVPNTDRPKISSAINLDYETQKREEWKDSAYENMLHTGTYSSSVGNLGEETQSRFAHYINLAAGSSYGNIASTSRRELIWRLKPNALFYDNNINYKLYSVIKVDIMKYDYTINGNEAVRDQVWYVKTSNADTFKPFVRAENYASAIIANPSTGNARPILNYNNAATFKSQTFSGTSWVSISSSGLATSFNTTFFTPDDYWYEFKIFDSLGNMHLNLPGIRRSSTTSAGGYVADSYSGNFDGTADGVVGYQVYTFLSDNSLTYNDLINKINEIDNSNPKVNQTSDYGAKIYQMADTHSFDKFIKADNVNTNNNIEIFQYGPANNNSLKVRIKPRAADIGKNGFIYIFMY